jgi:uncharacterized protein (TIGR02246 family)
MKWLKWAVLAAAGAMILGGCQKKVDTAAVADLMKSEAGEWAAAYNAGDGDKIAGFYTADGMVMPPHAPLAQGSDAIRQFAADDSAKAKSAGMTLAIEPTSADVSGDLAWQSGIYTVTDGSGNAVDTGKFVELRQNVNGKWKITRDIWNSDRPLSAPAADPGAEAPAS